MSRNAKALGISLRRVQAKDASFVDFEVKREDWNLYRIEDGTLLRARLILTGFWLDTSLGDLEKQLKEGKKSELGLGFRSRTIYAVECPPRLRGPPNSKRYDPVQLRSSVEKEDIDFQTIKETWNIYELENEIIVKVRISPIAVNRTTKFDNGGIRIYTVNANADAKVEFPKHIEKLLKEKRFVKDAKGKKSEGDKPEVNGRIKGFKESL